jgi:hypothetical protein
MTSSPVFEFHIAREARQRYGFADTLFAFAGNVVFANLAASREFAQRMNEVRQAQLHPERAVHPGALNAMGLIDEALHLVIALYRQQRDIRAMLDALVWFETRLGREALDRTLLAFVEQFPGMSVFRGERTAAEWLADSTADMPHRAVALEELLMLWLANLNPSFKPFAELFDDRPLALSTAYPQLTRALRDYFETRPRFGPDNQNLVDMLRAPALAFPESLAGQLSFMSSRWADLLGDFLRRLLTALDVLKEEEIAVWMRFHPPGAHFGPPLTFGDSSAAAIPSFTGPGYEYERFSQDVEWMPQTVLIAKSVHVWLHQLSRNYGRTITTLDQVPDQELDLLRRRGFNALWLIGVWERSRASQRIKRMTGNPEAAASAYSLADYAIAGDLGGEPAYLQLRDRAWARGMRLASDMVPNHMGIDSHWVIHHPDWFLSLPYPPYPAYSFNGPDVGDDSRVEIKIEDHYYDRTDAAVVFRRLDRWTGDARYIYHGNDGTSFPWNDTAQLNYLHPEVREAVIQTILHVARQFPIIRFDAAMTLTKQHYQRLWYPQPGSGGAIPSRAEHGLTKAEFDAAMPNEFWREVVDRVAAEIPGTLLLAEAFWLLEGYFVRTLGMHRVYNSAFMNMLRDEENANYRSVLKKTLEFDPEVLKRYVNFMNNPDERTAVDQFGKGDKYFGVCTLLATLPGLPMFGHGQVEGFGERYGMEYRRSYHEETPDGWLVARHEREIAPLLHRRALFAEARDFLLYDFFADEGWVNEDVFAYSNRLGAERALVVYNNRYNDTRGWIRSSCAYAEKTGDGGKVLRQRTLGESFGFSTDPAALVAFRDAFSGLEYLHRSSVLAEKGLRVGLGAYKTCVFLDWRDWLDDGTRPWRALCDQLGGAGVSSLDDALNKLELKPAHDALRAVLDSSLSVAMAAATRESAWAEKPQAEIPGPEPAGRSDAHSLNARLPQATERIRELLQEARQLAETRDRAGISGEPLGAWQGELPDAARHFDQCLDRSLKIPSLEQYFSRPWPEEARAVLPTITCSAAKSAGIWSTIVAWCALDALGRFHDPQHSPRASAELFDRLHLREPVAEAFAASGLEGEERWQAAARLRAGFAHPWWIPDSQLSRSNEVPWNWLHDPEVAWLVGLNEYQGVRYLQKERFERLLWWLALPRLLALAESPQPDREAVVALERSLQVRMRAAAESGYRVEALFGPMQ